VNDELNDVRVQIDRATARLLTTVAGFTSEDARQASLLPGWTRGHVLTHIARGGDAMLNLLQWARTGVPTEAYPSRDDRNLEIEEGAHRDVVELLADVTSSAASFRTEVVALPEPAWERVVGVLGFPDIPQFPASQLLTRRLVEIELHHTDLGAGYSPADWPATFAAMELPEPMRSQRDSRLTARPGSSPPGS
jgi:maleylpyruvate isomerase